MSLIGRPFPVATTAPATVVWTHQASLTDNADPQTFTSVGVGGAEGPHLVVIATSPMAAGAVSIAGMTIDGTTASEDLAATLTGGLYAYLWSAVVDLDGNPISVVIDWSTSPGTRVPLSAWVIATETTGAFDTGLSGASPGVASVLCPAGGVVIAWACDQSNGDGHYAWTGLTEDFDDTIPATAYGHSGASDAFEAEQNELEVQVAYTNSNASFGMIVASYAKEDSP